MSKLNFSIVPLAWRVALAFAAIYLIWGSTYLAIRFAIETIPPLLMGGVRFLMAGGVLYVVLRLRGVPAPTRVHWRSALVVGGLLLFGGNGGVIVAEQLVPSGMAALVIATVPLWMALLNWKWGDHIRPNVGAAIGLGLGVLGISLIAAPGASADSSAINPIGMLILVSAALFWSIGSLYSRHTNLPSNALLATSMEMLAGGALMLTVGLLLGQFGQVRLDHLALRSLAALGYLVVFGSLIGFTAYVWLLRVSTPARVSTYAFVNPVVAVFLGWALAGEALTPRELIAAAIIILAVMMITLNQARTRPRRSIAADTVSMINLDATDPSLAEST